MAQSDLVFVVGDLLNAHQCTVQAQMIVPHQITRRKEGASYELVQQMKHFDKRYHLVEEITDVQKNKKAYKVKIRWTGFDDDEDMTWEPIFNIRDDLPDVLQAVSHTAGERNLKREIIDLHF